MRIALLLSPAAIVIGVFFLGGVAEAVAQSFGYQPFLPGYHWSSAAARAIWRDPAVRGSLLITLRVSVLSTVIAAGLGVAGALAIRSLRRGRGWVTGLFQVNLAVPHLVGELSMLLLLLGQSGVIARLAHSTRPSASPAAFPRVTGDRFGWGIIAEYAWKETPFVGISPSPRSAAASPSSRTLPGCSARRGGSGCGRSPCRC